MMKKYKVYFYCITVGGLLFIISQLFSTQRIKSTFTGVLLYHDTKVTNDRGFRNFSTLQEIVKDEFEWPQGQPAAVWVKSYEDLQGRLQDMTTKIETLRQILKKNYHLVAEEEIQDKLEIIDGSDVNYLQLLSESGKFILVILPWLHNHPHTAYSSLTDNRNLQVQIYYEWIAESDICGWIKHATIGKSYHITYNYKCESNHAKTLIPKSIDLLTLNGRAVNNLFPTYPPYFSEQPPQFVTYMLISVNSVIDTEGDVLTDYVKYVPFTCGHDISKKPTKGYKDFTIYEEVFTIPQYWSTGFFHKNIESVPRIVPFLDFLQRNTQIYLHVPDNGTFTRTLLGYMGLSSNRFITGNIKAKIVYIPSTTECGTAQITNTQLLSKIYRNIIHNKLNSSKQNRSSLVLIRRSRSRKFTQQGNIEDVLKKVSHDYGLTFEMFVDNPPPPLGEAMRMFNRAVMVVAPHGAGLFNLVYSEPGTFVIEAVCNRPHLNFCFQRLAYILGHHYHAIASKRGCEGVVDVDANDIDRIVRLYVKEAVKLVIK